MKLWRTKEATRPKLAYLGGGYWECGKCGRRWSALDVPSDERCPCAGTPMQARTLSVDLATGETFTSVHQDGES